MSEPVWYEEGLRFSCTRCGNCCKGPGYVWVDDAEIDQLATHFGMDFVQFEKVYTRKVGKSRSLREQASDDCIFYDDSVGCMVYEVRPRQCRTWPFWDHNLESPDRWNEVKTRCPGSGIGDLYTVEQITEKLRYQKDGSYSPLPIGERGQG